MAAFTHSEPAPLGAVTFYRLVAFVERNVENFRRWRAARAIVRELRSLSTRQLDDIGVIPGDIEEMAWRLTARP